MLQCPGLRLINNLPLALPLVFFSGATAFHCPGLRLAYLPLALLCLVFSGTIEFHCPGLGLAYLFLLFLRFVFFLVQFDCIVLACALPT